MFHFIIEGLLCLDYFLTKKNFLEFRADIFHESKDTIHHRHRSGEEEKWVGETDEIFFSTGLGNIYIRGKGGCKPRNTLVSLIF